ncbi:RolB family protein [Rhizobium mesoamericanum]
MSFPAFDRPRFQGAVLDDINEWGLLRPVFEEIVWRYESFLENELVPAQNDYADTLESDEIYDADPSWHEGLSGVETDDLLESFRQIACMNNPTEHVLEPISASPKVLYVYVDEESVSSVRRQHLGSISSCFRFSDQGVARMLAYETPPYATDASFPSLRSVVSKYQSLGCQGVRRTSITRCLAVPWTPLFRAEGGGFHSRKYFGSFDVLASMRARHHPN